MMISSPRKYFGDVDASNESATDLDRQFVGEELFQRIVGPTSHDGAQVVIGLKGMGKTALGRVAIERFTGAKWYRSERSSDYRFEIPEIKLRSGVLMGMIKVFIIEQFVEQLLRDQVIERTDFDKYTGILKNLGTKFAKATEVSAGFISFKPSEFFSVDNQKHFSSAWESSVDFLRKNLGNRESLIVLDDVDTYFVGLEHHPRFIEGICRAVAEINAISNPKIFCLLLLKQGIWRTLFEKPEEYDKIKQSMEFLKWDFLGCISVLSGRIASIHGMDQIEIKEFVDAVPFLKLEFEGNARIIKACVEEIFSYSVNGPRDVIDLCNNIRRAHPQIKINKSMVSERAANYSEEKLYALNGDFGHIFPDIPQFIQVAFEGFKSEFTGTELSERLESHVKIDPNIGAQAFAQHHWYRDATTKNLVKKLFDIGIIGIVRNRREPLFANESNTVSQNSLLASNLVLHKAYRPALGVN